MAKSNMLQIKDLDNGPYREVDCLNLVDLMARASKDDMPVSIIISGVTFELSTEGKGSLSRIFSLTDEAIATKRIKIS